VAGLEVEVFGAQAIAGAPSTARIGRLCAVAAAAGGVQAGHVGIEFVDGERIAALNAEHRGRSGPTDVLSFPIDGAGPADGASSPGGATVPVGAASSSSSSSSSSPPDAPPSELGDVVICAEHTVDLCEAIVHGVLHLVGMDHECDEGEMLAVQAEVLRWENL
jgi:probable rRNA maturation factor